MKLFAIVAAAMALAVMPLTADAAAKKKPQNAPKAQVTQTKGTAGNAAGCSRFGGARGGPDKAVCATR